MASTSGSVGGEVTGETGSPLAKPSLPPPRPKSPPEYPDLYGKRREAARVQMLEREIGYLEAKVVDLLNLGSYYIQQGENKFIEGAQPASRCCKEVSDFVVANSDPLIPAQRKNRRHCRFWKWLCCVPCLSLASFCCCCQSECSCHLRKPKCCNFTSCCCVGSKCCDGSCCSNICCCPKPSCPSCSCFRGCCCSCPDLACCIPTCFRSCSRPSCLNKKKSSCCSCNCKIRWSSCCRCPNVRLCCCFCNCKNLCSNPCCLTF
ncbi:BnaC09g37230D [Brassica napus]|uniref:BnaC09g37230D protein n=1 Tax=Brassica napus TaxID=3708 RepID=A0A078FQ36_BRANA|nr:BnaC09g37230D [Brassica napus]